MKLEKILLVFLLFTLLISIHQFCFASLIGSDSVSYPDIPTQYLGYNYNYVIFSDSKSNIFLVIFANENAKPKIENGYLFSSVSNGRMIGFLLSGNSWVQNFDKTSSVNEANGFVFKYSTCDVYKDNELFFLKTVVLVEEVQELPRVIAETMKVIIPVGLIVLAVILLIYLIKRVIYLSH